MLDKEELPLYTWDQNCPKEAKEMRTLAKSCGYKRRSENFISEIHESLEELELYIYDGYDKVGKASITPGEYIREIMDVEMNEYIRLYSY